MAHLVDANCFVRLFLQDDKKKARAVDKLFKSRSESLFIPDVLIAEVVWLLFSFYKIPKRRIIDSFPILLEYPVFSFNRGRIFQTFLYWKEYNIDFIDAYLATVAQEKELEGIYSYDRDFDKVKGLKRLEP